MYRVIRMIIFEDTKGYILGFLVKVMEKKHRFLLYKEDGGGRVGLKYEIWSEDEEKYFPKREFPGKNFPNLARICIINLLEFPIEEIEFTTIPERVSKSGGVDIIPASNLEVNSFEKEYRKRMNFGWNLASLMMEVQDS